MTCTRCGVPLTYNEKGLNKKYNADEKGGERCIGCLADKLGVTTARLREKISEFLAVGCVLFMKDE